MEVITVPHVDYTVEKQAVTDQTEELLVDCSYYKVWKFQITDTKDYEMKEAFQIVSVIECSGTVEGHAVKKGDHSEKTTYFFIHGSFLIVNTHYFPNKAK